MCGIAGMLTTRPLPETEAAVERMISSSRHRGPDGNGRASIPLHGEAGHLVLGHARLSILDLSEMAAQPMHDPQTESWLVYNGEIYNFRALRAILTAEGCTFRSHGDTEVLLKALVSWGESALPRLRGMYAFAFWDGRRRRLLLGRDPLGIKPLLLARTRDAVLFASELLALRNSGVQALTLNTEAVSSYLTYGMTVEPATIATEVLAVPPGHVVVIDAGGHAMAPRPVCSLDQLLPDTADGSISNGLGHRHLRDELARSVADHLVSDVPVGVFLSGGIDSSIIATLAGAGDGRGPLHLLTVGFPEREFSEVQHARRVAATLPADHHIIDLNPNDVVEILPRALDAMDQPTADGINTYVISTVAADLGIKVLLSGLGGDEVFGGYTTFRKAPLLARHPHWLSAVAKIAPDGIAGRSAQWHKLARSTHASGLPGTYLLQRSIRWRGATSCLRLNSVPPDDAAIPAETWDAMTRGGGAADVYRIARLEMSFYMRNQLLRDADIFGSANSVEIRVPLLDVDLIKKAWQLHPRDHVSLWGGGKKVLKGILATMHPGLDVTRQKMGFVLPWSQWLRGPLFERVADTFATKRLFAPLGLDHREGQALLRSFRKREPLVSWIQVWSLFVLLSWQERFRLSA